MFTEWTNELSGESSVDRGAEPPSGKSKVEFRTSAYVLPCGKGTVWHQELGSSGLASCCVILGKLFHLPEPLENICHVELVTICKL